MNDIYPKTKYSIIRNTKIFLKLDENHQVTYTDVENFKKYMNHLLYYKNLSPSEISKMGGLNSNYNYSLFLSKCLKIKLRNNKDATNNFLIQNNKKRTNKKENYWRECKFKFSPYTEKNILGYELLNIGVFEKPQNKNDNTIYLHRDHMLSISYGWEHNIDPKIISHPANCRIMKEIDNIKKGNKCSISYDDLLDRIKNWN